MSFATATCAKCGKTYDEHAEWPRSDDDCDFVTPESEYKLTSYPAHPNASAVTYIHAEGSPWTLQVETTYVTLILGDMGYHQIQRYELHGDIRRTAEIYDETGAADDIEQILLAAKRLLK